jgi:aerobic-type carbon monoxide dehydrogenase small subunit (CoxS/CutS family)
MKSRKDKSRLSSASQADKRVVKPVQAAGGVVGQVADAKVTRRTLLKGTATAAAVVGVSAVTLSNMQLQPKLEQSTSTSTYAQITPTQTNTGTVPAAPPITTTDPFGARTVTLNVNGTNYSLAVTPRSMLADVLRDNLGLIATKKVCNRASCGACTVLIDGAPHEACHEMTLRVAGHTILTAEIGAAKTPDPVVAALQNAWVAQDGGQCNYCGPGNIMAATALLKSNPKPTVPQIKAALSGNLCRCGNYVQIIAAVQAAAATLGGA